LIAQLELSAHENSVTEPPTFGVTPLAFVAVVPSPSCPLEFNPQHFKTPSVKRAQE